MNQQKWGERQRKAEMTNKRPTDAKKEKRTTCQKSKNPFSLFCRKKYFAITLWAVVVAHLVERSLPTPEICCSNPNINKFIWLRVYCLAKTNINQRGRECPSLKKTFAQCFFSGIQAVWLVCTKESVEGKSQRNHMTGSSDKSIYTSWRGRLDSTQSTYLLAPLIHASGTKISQAVSHPSNVLNQWRFTSVFDGN